MAATQGYMLLDSEGRVCLGSDVPLDFGVFCVNTRTPRGLEDKWFPTTKGLSDGLAWHKPNL